MNLDEKTILKIERYLSDAMNAEEKAGFQAEVNASKEIREFLHIYYEIDVFEDEEDWILYQGDKEKVKDVAKLFQKEDTAEFSRKLQTFQKDYNQQISSKNRPWLKIAMSTAIAACLLALLYVTLFQSSNLTNIYEDHNSWDELPSLTIKGDAVVKDPSEIELSFNEQNYTDVIIFCNDLLSTSNEIRPNILLYLGISQLEMKQYQDAENTFNLLASSSTLDHHKGYWYLALTYMKQEKSIEAKETLLQISKNNTFYRHAEAVQILQKLE